MMLTPRLLKSIEARVVAADGREVCGFITRDVHGEGEFFPLPNRSRDHDAFWVSRVDERRFARMAARHQLQVVAFLHSHRAGLELSENDRISFETQPLPWVVVTRATGTMTYRVYEAPTVPVPGAG